VKNKGYFVQVSEFTSVFITPECQAEMDRYERRQRRHRRLVWAWHAFCWGFLAFLLAGGGYALLSCFL